MLFWIAAFASLLLPRCATEPSSGTSTAGSAIFRYSDGEFDVVLTIDSNSSPKRIIAAGVLFAVDSVTGVRTQASSIESGTRVTWPESLSFTLASCAQTPTFVSSEVYDTFKIFYYLFPTSCDSQAGTTTASAPLTVDRDGQPTKILNGSGSGGGSTLSQHTIFITSTVHDGNLGGLAGADAICAARAAAGTATSTLEGTWKAVLSDATTAANSRIDLTNVALKNTIGETVLASATALWGGSLLTRIRYNENGADAGAVSLWTSTNPNGTYNGPSCINWTSNNIINSALLGDSTQTDSDWILDGNLNDCATGTQLYCINVN